jgi:hypothetical protein
LSPGARRDIFRARGDLRVSLSPAEPRFLDAQAASQGHATPEYYAAPVIRAE